MRENLLELLACTACGSEMTLHAERREGAEVLEGRLSCLGCDVTHPVERGVPRMVVASDGLARTRRAFSYQWRAYHRGELADEGAYGQSDAYFLSHFTEGTGLDATDLRDLVILDAGCGHAELDVELAASGARAVVAFDLSDTVDEIFERTRGADGVHVVQGNLFAAPFRQICDVVWCEGVIHHTPDAAEAFRCLARYVRPGGLLWVWVYPDTFTPWLSVKGLLDSLGLERLSDPTILRLAGILSYPSYAIHSLYRTVRRLPGLRPRSERGFDTTRYLNRRAFHMLWHDTLAAPLMSRHHEGELRQWFTDAGFTELVVSSGPKLGMRGRAPDA